MNEYLSSFFIVKLYQQMIFSMEEWNWQFCKQCNIANESGASRLIFSLIYSENTRYQLLLLCVDERAATPPFFHIGVKVDFIFRLLFSR
jgi:hypothetical protein